MSPRPKPANRPGRRASGSPGKANTPLFIGLIGCLLLAASALVAPAASGAVGVDGEEGVDATLTLGDTVVDPSVGGAEGVGLKLDQADLQ